MIQYKTIGVIPARGNSKGIPGKNMVHLGGSPLILHTLSAALMSDLSLVVLSTESDEIASVCAEYALHIGERGRLHIIERPPYLSMDHVQVNEVVLHALRELEYTCSTQGCNIDGAQLVILQPTSPFRDSTDINDALTMHRVMNRGGDNYTTVSVTSPPYIQKYLWETATVSGDFNMTPVGHDPEHRVGRQWAEKDREFAFENGAIYVVDIQKLSLGCNFRLPPYAPYYMAPDKSIDIDTENDLQAARDMYSKWKRNE